MDEDKTLKYKYFIDKFILFAQKYHIDDLKKCTMKWYSKILLIYLCIDKEIIKIVSIIIIIIIQSSIWIT